MSFLRRESGKVGQGVLGEDQVFESADGLVLDRISGFAELYFIGGPIDGKQGPSRFPGVPQMHGRLLLL